MEVKLNADAVAAIEAALKQGKDVWIYRNRSGVVISSQTRKTLYSTVQETERERAIRAIASK